jgi:large subunit ribosomal protein L24
MFRGRGAAEEQEMLGKRLKKGDTVKVIAGREKGKTGKIQSTIVDKARVVIEKVNLIKRHKKPDAKAKGGIIEKEGPIHVSNVMYLCNKCGTGVRIGYKILEDGKKVRVCAKCHEILDT